MIRRPQRRSRCRSRRPASRSSPSCASRFAIFHFDQQPSDPAACSCKKLIHKKCGKWRGSWAFYSMPGMLIRVIPGRGGREEVAELFRVSEVEPVGFAVDGFFDHSPGAVDGSRPCPTGWQVGPASGRCPRRARDAARNSSKFIRRGVTPTSGVYSMVRLAST